MELAFFLREAHKKLMKNVTIQKIDTEVDFLSFNFFLLIFRSFWGIFFLGAGRIFLGGQHLLWL